MKWFLLLFANGGLITQDDLSICEDWILSNIECPAPLLEYAVKNKGMSVTISDDIVWRVDFFDFIDKPLNLLPNIYGQSDLSPIVKCLKDWSIRNNEFENLLANQLNVAFCQEAFNTYYPNNEEQIKCLESFQKAKSIDYRVDGDLIKIFKSKYGNIFELRMYSEGYRLFYVLKDGNPIVGGFYRKSASDIRLQNKAGDVAATRLRSAGYL